MKIVPLRESYHIIDKCTGEVIQIRNEGNKKWQKSFTEYLVGYYSVIDNPQLRFMNWLLVNKDYDNRIVYSYAEMSRLSGVSLSTVKRVVRLLIKENYLKRSHRSVYMINPRVMGDGTSWHSALMMKSYDDI